MAKAKWFIVVQPPANYGEPFDIPEWSYRLAYDTHNRYKARGWDAVLVPGDAEESPWYVRGRGLDELQVMARSADEAIMLARAKDPNYDEVQRMS